MCCPYLPKRLGGGDGAAHLISPCDRCWTSWGVWRRWQLWNKVFSAGWIFVASLHASSLEEAYAPSTGTGFSAEQGMLRAMRSWPGPGTPARSRKYGCCDGAADGRCAAAGDLRMVGWGCRADRMPCACAGIALGDIPVGAARLRQEIAYRQVDRNFCIGCSVRKTQPCPVKAVCRSLPLPSSLTGEEQTLLRECLSGIGHAAAQQECEQWGRTITSFALKRSLWKRNRRNRRGAAVLTHRLVGAAAESVLALWIFVRAGGRCFGLNG